MRSPMLMWGSFRPGPIKMKLVITALALMAPLIAHADYVPFDKQQPINFECQTGVKIHVVDTKHVVINGNFDAEISELSADRLQAQGNHDKGNLATTIDLRFMGGGYYSLLTTELDQTGVNVPWETKVLGMSAVICQRTQ